MKQKVKELIGFKKYLKDFLLFLDKEIVKKAVICFIISIILCALSLSTITKAVTVGESIYKKVGFVAEYWNRFQIICIIPLAGLVPYIYAPAVGVITSSFNEVSNLALLIKEFGYLKGILTGIVPSVLDLLVISIVISLGMYICNKITIGYKITNVKNMNLTNFKIRLYEVLGKEKEKKELEEKKQAKIQKLEQIKEKLNYLQILNTILLASVIQLISTAVQVILT